MRIHHCLWILLHALHLLLHVLIDLLRTHARLQHLLPLLLLLRDEHALLRRHLRDVDAACLHVLHIRHGLRVHGQGTALSHLTSRNIYAV